MKTEFLCDIIKEEVFKLPMKLYYILKKFIKPLRLFF